MNVHQMTHYYGKWYGGKVMISEKKAKIEPKRKIIGSAIVKDGPLNVRKTPSKDGEQVGQLQKGQRVNVTEGSANDFTAIIFKDDICFAMTQYLDVIMTA